MTGVEIFLTIFMLLTLPVLAFKIGKEIAYKTTFYRRKQDKILKDINDYLHVGLNNKMLTKQELKKLKIKKDKFLTKIVQLVKEISKNSGLPLEPTYFYDDILSEKVLVDLVKCNTPNNKYFYDCKFAFETIKYLITDNKFPSKEDYIKLNSLYKKYKKLNFKNIK